MDHKNPNANVPESEQPLGDLGHEGKTWTPEPGEQGISNRVEDEETGPEDEDGLPDDAKQRVPS